MRRSCTTYRRQQPDAPLRFRSRRSTTTRMSDASASAASAASTIKAGERSNLERHRRSWRREYSRCSRSGLTRESVAEAVAGDIVAVTGIEDVHIGYTICDVEHPDALPPIAVDEPSWS